MARARHHGEDRAIRIGVIARHRATQRDAIGSAEAVIGSMWTLRDAKVLPAEGGNAYANVQCTVYRANGCAIVVLASVAPTGRQA